MQQDQTADTLLVAAAASGSAALDPAMAPPGAGASRRPRLWSRIRRRVHLPKLLLSIGLLAGAAYFFAPSLVWVQSEEAVTNAEVVVVRSPINGLVASSALAQGAPFAKGDTLAIIVNRHADNSALTDVEARERAAQNRIAALDGEIAVLGTLEEKLKAEFSSWLAGQRASLELQRQQVRNQIEANRTRELTLKSDVERYRMLAASSAAAVQRLEQAQRDHQSAVSDAQNARLEMLRVDQDLAALERGLVLRGVEDRTKTLQLLDDVSTRLALNRNQLAAQKRELASLERERHARAELLDRQSRATIAAPFDGVVWKLFSAETGQVTVNHELMEIADCGRVFVSALFKQRHLGRLEPGRDVTVRLVGLGTTLRGRIARLGGYNESDTRSAAQAIRLPSDKSAEILAVIELDEPPPGCILGAHGVVRLDR